MRAPTFWVLALMAHESCRKTRKLTHTDTRHQAVLAVETPKRETHARVIKLNFHAKLAWALM